MEVSSSAAPTVESNHPSIVKEGTLLTEEEASDQEAGKTKPSESICEQQQVGMEKSVDDKQSEGIGQSSAEQLQGVEKSVKESSDVLTQLSSPSGSQNREATDLQACPSVEEGSQEGSQEGQTLVTFTVDKAGRYHCAKCDVTAQGHVFEEHLMCHIVLKPYQCLYCSQFFKNRRQVSAHVLEMHAGQKMNCALRALKRVKEMMKMASESGKHEFYACVPGKVPLVKHPSKSGDKLKASKTDRKSCSCAKDCIKECCQAASKSITCSATVLESKSDVQDSSSEEKGAVEKSSDSLTSDDSSGERSQDSNPGISCGQHQDNDAAAAAAGEQDKNSDNNNCSQNSDNSVDENVNNIEDGNTDNENIDDSSDKNCLNASQNNDDTTANCESEIEESASEFSSNLSDQDKKAVNNSKSCTVDRLPASPSSVTDKNVNEEVKMDETSAENPQKSVMCDENSDHEETIDKDVSEVSSDCVKTTSDEQRSVNLEHSDMDTEEPAHNSESDGTELGQERREELPQSAFEQNEDDSNTTGLKIIAAFSLQDDTAQEQSAIEPKELNRIEEDMEVSTHADSQQPDDTTSDAQSVSDGDNATEAEPATEARAAPLTLGPPSKPVPSSSFLDLPPHSSPITSHGTGAQDTQSSSHFFICGFHCSFSCLTSPEFRDHLMLDHAGETIFTCYHCGYQAVSEEALIRHLSAHAHTYSKSAPLYICGASACKFGSNLLTDFITHQSSWHSDLTVFHCHDCDERFASVPDLLQHFQVNFLHIINCPHCMAKTTERRSLLSHIASAHPGKPKMVSVAKQIMCRDRKLNNYFDFLQQRYYMADCESYSLDTADADSVHQKSNFDEASAASIKNKCLLSILTEPIQPQEQELTKRAVSSHQNESEITGEENGGCNESFDDEEECCPEDQNGANSPEIKSEEINNFKCKFCTFVARDPSRLEGHERGHGLPSSRKTRFKCMYCPQSFNNDVKFNSHVSCHPGLIRFNLFCCKQCDFDSNQRHIIVKHARSTHDKGCASVEDDLYTVVSKTIETRVLECYNCSYMTRHRKHLLDHVKREHSGPKKMGGYVYKYPSQSAGEDNSSAGQMNASPDFLASENTSIIRENSIQRFKCPICQYLLPRAADLQAHVKRHSEIKEITLVMFRCKYCSSASTAREIVYNHLMEKHAGKQIALVKKIVKIDTWADDKGYAVTSVDDEKNSGTERPALTRPAGPDDHMVLVIPDSAGETFHSSMHCPRCAFASSTRRSIIAHVSAEHPEVKIMGRRQDSELYPLDVSRTSSRIIPGGQVTVGEALKGEILIVPDNPTFEEAVICPKCKFSTLHRRSMVQHLEENHPEVSVMGRNDYPSFEGNDQAAMEANAVGKDGMVIIGSGSLDEKIRCLYENEGDKMRCMICNADRPKKFFIHVHILRHLNILLWGCQYCSHKGLQKYKMMDHIKKVHPKRAYCVRYLPVNVEEKVNQYLKNASMIQARREDGDGAKSPSSFQLHAVDTTVTDLPQKHSVGQDDLMGCIIGSDELDMKLACLYSVVSDGQYHCVVCAQEFHRKLAMHRHIVQTHLKVNLIGCGYCHVEAVERHVMTDHILEAHKSSTLSMRNLGLRLKDKVDEFLGHMTLSAEATLDPPSPQCGADASDDNDDDDDNSESPDHTQCMPAVDSLEVSSPYRAPSHTSNNSKNQLNPSLLLLGRDSLNKHLQCMFRAVPGPVTKFRCQVCRGIFNRKYAIHRHLLMKHLKVGIIGCPYCSFEGVERYQVLTHIKEDHKGAEPRTRHLSVDLHLIVPEYMRNVDNGTVDPNSNAPPPWSMRKTVKKEVVVEAERDPQPSASPGVGHGLVVAMFGNRRTEFRIKQEPEEIEEGETSDHPPVDLEISGIEENEENSNDFEEAGDDAEERTEFSSVPQHASNGTRAKLATDVQTTIRVITVKDKGIRRHTCEKCKFTSLHRSNVVRHIYRVHEQYREQECPYCNYRTLSKKLIEQHLQNEHPGSAYPGGLADRGMKRKAEAISDSAEYNFSKKCHLSPSVEMLDTDNLTEDDAETQLFPCANCSFKARTQSEIVQHVQTTHCSEGMEDAGEDGQNAQAECGACPDDEMDDTEFASLASTVKMSQVNLSEGTEDCLLQCFCCTYKTSDEKDLKLHFMEMHPRSEYRCKKVPTFRFVCRSCNVKTRAHSKMRYHLNRHINYRPYTCTTCGTYYPSPDQCRKHCRANGHNETFTYVKIPRKEKRLQELLKESQQIALALTMSPEDTEIPKLSYATPVPSKRKAKKSFPPGVPGKLCKTEYDAEDPAYEGLQEQEERGREEGEQMACASCDFSAQTVLEVRTHFLNAHPDQDFLWRDTSMGHVCTETGEITNAKDVPPMLDGPPDSGYCVTGSGLLSCRHCHFSTSTVQAMKSHVKRHQPKRYLCPYCSMRCSRKDTVTLHVNSAHKGRELWTIFFHQPENSADDVDSEKSMGLSEPQVTFKDAQAEERGDASPPLTPRSYSLSKRIGCGQCDRKQESVAAAYEHHSESHADLPFLWVDSSNGYTFNFLGEVVDAKEQTPELFTKKGFRVETDSRNVPSFSCRLCAFTSAYIQAIKSHMKSHLPHGFMCPYCCMTTSSKEKMVSHQSCVHKGQDSWVMHLRMTSEPSASSRASPARERSKEASPLSV
ncbi:uncharacterized protein LOC143291079 [Babylonia areolata]|uniref:uncharacterized protein LOC143291079 n=1 Tax=Babylonia areolata TaxID=304850 RepID=UPI003FD4A17A